MRLRQLLAAPCVRARLGAAMTSGLVAACGGGGGDTSGDGNAGGGGGGGGGGGIVDPTVSAVAINPLSADQSSLLVTIQGAGLDQGLNVTAAACATLTRSSTAPLASSATVAYYQCTMAAAAAAVVEAVATRSRDNAPLGSASITLGAQPTVTAALAGEGAVGATPGAAKYGQPLTVKVSGTNVNQGLSVSSAACSDVQLSVSPPLVSNATTAYYRCNVTAIALNQVSVALASDPDEPLFSPLFEVPEPQVTMTLRQDTLDLGSIVMTLKPAQVPITVDNFLNYVNSGFYDGTVFHRVAVLPTPFVIQGGGYVSALLSIDRPKPTDPPIVLEVNRGLSNVQWSVAMARLALPDSATSQFFINLADNVFLDAAQDRPGYAVFGMVTAGIDVVNAVANSPCQPITGLSECTPIPNVVIVSATQTR